MNNDKPIPKPFAPYLAEINGDVINIYLPPHRLGPIGEQMEIEARKRLEDEIQKQKDQETEK